MTEAQEKAKEKALIYFKNLQEQKLKGYSIVLDVAPKGSVTHEAVSAEIEMYNIAIKAMEQGFKAMEQGFILDKLRAELLDEKECAYADFESYKVEYLGQDWEDVYDSLPQDDFRYGIERCINLIDRYKAENKRLEEE